MLSVVEDARDATIDRMDLLMNALTDRMAGLNAHGCPQSRSSRAAHDSPQHRDGTTEPQHHNA